jgi:hypothetical protein
MKTWEWWSWKEIWVKYTEKKLWPLIGTSETGKLLNNYNKNESNLEIKVSELIL